MTAVAGTGGRLLRSRIGPAGRAGSVFAGTKGGAWSLHQLLHAGELAAEQSAGIFA